MAANFVREAKARFDAAINREIGFVERLVWFWSNYFCVNLDTTVMAGAYEREAIRPHILGNFTDLLLAAESHPAMLIYLDNVSSMGPNSVAGINRTRGLNENLAREILSFTPLARAPSMARTMSSISPRRSPAGPSSRPRAIRTMAASSSITPACTSPVRRR